MRTKEEIFKEMYQSQIIIQDITERCMRESLQAREDQILKALEDNGYKFENRIELIDFAKKNRCEVIRFKDMPKVVLRVNGIQICEWWETSRFEQDGNIFRCIIGESPSES